MFRARLEQQCGRAVPLGAFSCSLGKNPVTMPHCLIVSSHFTIILIHISTCYHGVKVFNDSLLLHVMRPLSNFYFQSPSSLSLEHPHGLATFHLGVFIQEHLGCRATRHRGTDLGTPRTQHSASRTVRERTTKIPGTLISFVAQKK